MPHLQQYACVGYFQLLFYPHDVEVFRADLFPILSGTNVALPSSHDCNALPEFTFGTIAVQGPRQRIAGSKPRGQLN
jgi:hypothetical protein